MRFYYLIQSRPVHLILFILFLSFIFFLHPSPGTAEIYDRIIAKVGPDVITLSELEEMSRQSEIDLNGETKKKILDFLIDRILLVQAAKKEKIDIQEARINISMDRELNRIRQNFPTRTDYDNWLNRQGLTEPELKIRLKDRILQELMINQYLRKKTAPITEIQIQDYTKSNPEEAEKQEMVRIRHIFLSLPENPTPEDEQKLREKAYRIYHELKAGGKFEELAYVYSDDSATNENGGDLGYIRHGEIFPELEKVAFELDTNQLSEPIKTGKGYHIIWITEKASVREFLYQKILKETEEKLIRELRDKVPITIKG